MVSRSNPRLAFRLCCFFVAGVIFSVPSIDGQPTDGTDSLARSGAAWLPADTVAVARFADVKQFKRQWRASSFGAQADDPAFAEFFSGVADTLTSGLADVDLNLLQLLEDVEGEFLVGVLNHPSGGLSMLGVAQLNDDETAEQYLNDLESKLSKQSPEPTRVRVNERQLTSWTRSTDGGVDRISYLRQGDQVVFAGGLEVLAQAARRVDQNRDKGGGLIDNASYLRVMDEVTVQDERSGVHWYVNPLGMIDAAIGAGGVNIGGAVAMKGLLQTAGLDQLKGLGGSFWLGRGGMDSVSSTYAYIPGTVTGIWKSLKLPATQQRPPNWVKDDVSLYSQMNFRPDQFLQALEDTIDQASGEGTFDRAVGSMKLGGTDVTVGEVGEALAGPIHISGIIPENASEILSQKMIIAIESDDRETLGRLTEALASKNGGESKTIGQTEIHRFAFDVQAIEGMPPLELAVAVTDDGLMLSPNAEYLEDVIGGAAESRALADSPQYQEIAQQFPERTSVINYQRQDGRLEGLYEQLRSGALPGSGLPGLAGSLLSFDFTKLPEFSAMSRYLQSTGSFVVPKEDGFQIISFATPPREQ